MNFVILIYRLVKKKSIYTSEYILKCAFEKIGLFNETNCFNVERIVKTEMDSIGRSESDARSIAEKCAVKKGCI